MLAFFSPGSAQVKMEGMKKTLSFPEKHGEEVAFDSVFVKDDHHVTGPAIARRRRARRAGFPARRGVSGQAGRGVPRPSLGTADGPCWRD